MSPSFLFHLFRGTSLRGLSGIRPVRDKIIRPLLCLSRDEIEAFLLERNVFRRIFTDQMIDMDHTDLYREHFSDLKKHQQKAAGFIFQWRKQGGRCGMMRLRKNWDQKKAALRSLTTKMTVVRPFYSICSVALRSGGICDQVICFLHPLTRVADMADCCRTDLAHKTGSEADGQPVREDRPASISSAGKA